MLSLNNSPLTLINQGLIPINSLNIPVKRMSVFHICNEYSLGKLRSLNSKAQICASTHFNIRSLNDLNLDANMEDDEVELELFIVEMNADVHFRFHSDLYTDRMPDNSRYINLGVLTRLYPKAQNLLDICTNTKNLTDLAGFEQELNKLDRASNYNEFIVSNFTITGVFSTLTLGLEQVKAKLAEIKPNAI